MNNQSKVIFAIIIIVVIISLGAFWLYNKDRNITNIPISNEQSDKECDSNNKCMLTSINIGCSACDYADSSWQCLNQEKSSEIRKRYQKFMNSPNAPQCAMCMPYESPLMFRCICENGKCLKTSACDSDNDCMSFRGDYYKCIDNQCKYIDK